MAFRDSITICFRKTKDLQTYLHYCLTRTKEKQSLEQAIHTSDSQ